MSHSEDFATGFPTLLDVLGEDVVFDGTATVSAIVDRQPAMEMTDTEGLEASREATVSILASELTPIIGTMATFDSQDWYASLVEGPKDGVYEITVKSTQILERGRQNYRGQ